MPRKRNPKFDEAKALFLEGMKLADVSMKLDIRAGTVRRWKSTYKWDNEISKNKTKVKNKGGAPKGNKNAEKHGLFSKYLPAETLELVEAAGLMNPLDILWDQISVQYATIIRSQSIMYVSNKDEKSHDKISKNSEDAEGNESCDKESWDKQANFLSAQSRAMTSLSGMIKRYDELLHKNWELATEEQRARVENIKVGTAKLKSQEDKDKSSLVDDWLTGVMGDENG